MVIYMDRFGKVRALTIPDRSPGGGLARASRSEAAGAVALPDISGSRDPGPRLADVINGVDVRHVVERLRALASQI